jgi:hypothetical protein
MRIIGRKQRALRVDPMNVPARLLPILGRPLDELSEENLAHLIGVREDEDLDFKSALYGSSDKDKAELAADIASFANTRGGLIVIGIHEESNEALRLVPVELPTTQEEDLRIHLVVAGRIAPPPRVDVRIIPSACSGKGFVLIAVPRSPAAPHAVRDGDHLRYLVRSGPGKRALSESEVADAYARRMHGLADQTQRIHVVHDECLSRVDREVGAWLSVALVPDVPGSIELNVSTPRRIAEWFRQRKHTCLRSSILNSEDLQPSINIQRVVLSSYRQKGSMLAAASHFELYTDGAGAGAVVVGRLRTSERADPHQFDEELPSRFAIVHDETLVFETAHLLMLLAAHAVENTATFGSARVLAAVGLMRDDQGEIANLLYHYRGDFGGGAVSGRFVTEEVASEHTIDLGELSAPGPTQLAVARFVLLDLWAGFGYAEPWQISPDGQIRRLYLRQWKPAAEEWASRTGVAVVDEIIHIGA